MLSPACHKLIDDFFEALQLRQWDTCRETLHALEQRVRSEPDGQSWHTYLSGIFVMEAERDFAASERLLRALLAQELAPTLRGRVLNSLGLGYDYQGRWPEALAAYEQCLQLFDQRQQEVGRVKAWKNMAQTLQKGFFRGEFGDQALQQAAAYCQQALATLAELKDQDRAEPWLEAVSWNELGLIYCGLGDWPQATACYKQFLDLSQTLNDEHSIGMGHNNLGEVLHQQGAEKWPEARQAYLTALKIYRDFGDTYEEIDALANLASLHHHMGDLTTALTYYDQAIDLIEAVRASVTAEAGRMGYFTTVAHIYANAALLCLEMNEPERAFNIVEQSCSRAFLDVLVAGSVDLPRERELAPTITLPQVQAALPPDALLLEYFTTGLLEVGDEGDPAQPTVRRHRFPPAKTLLFAITRDTLQVHDVGVAPNDLRPDHLDSVVERHFLAAPIRRTLYQRLLAPVAPLLAGKRRLYLVPHGPLHYIPFQTLLAPDGQTLLREDGPQLIYSPSATLLFHYKRYKRPAVAPRSCLAIGYNEATATQLDLAEDEARRIARLTNGHALVGDSPKKPRLYRQAANYRWLHLACHSEFDPESPLNSFLQLAPAEKLTALEIMEKLRLQCDLVTLSACESGLSRIRRGDELIGLMRALMYAGASALVSTLWRVYEQPTRILMERFYEHLQAGLECAEALKRAQLYVKELTYQEAMTILTTPAETPPEQTAASTLTPPAPAADTVRQAMNVHQATAYLRGAAHRGQSDVAPTLPAEPDPDYKIFADPYYWAAFILIGDHVA